MLPQIGKLLIISGVLLVLIGILLLFTDKIPFLGKMPGDIVYRKGNFTLYVPIVSMILLSLLLTIILKLFRK